MSDEGFIGRWSRKKRESTATAKDGAAAPEAVPPEAASAAERGAPVPLATASAPEALPPLESLTPHSDFSAFLRPDVDAGTRAQALKTLFGDPALYPMDGLDVYIDDYSKPDPLPEGWLEKLNQFAALDDVPRAEEEARKKEEQARAASEPAPPASPPAGAEPVAPLADAATGTGEPARASDLLPPGDSAVDPIHRDAI